MTRSGTKLVARALGMGLFLAAAVAAVTYISAGPTPEARAAQEAITMAVKDLPAAPLGRPPMDVSAPQEFATATFAMG